jgi:MFS family permease
MKLPASLAVLRNRDFRLYWFGQGISLVGTWMQMMAQGWVVTGLTSAAWVLGALNVTGTFPILMLSMQGGAFADRYEKRRILIVTQIAMMLLAFTFAGLMFSHRIVLWHVFALAFLLGIATAFDFPAAQALPPELVQREEIPKAVALMQAVFHGSRFIGPALAGIVVAKFGEGSAFLGNGLSFLAVIATLMLIADRKRPDGAQKRRGGMGEGFRYVRGNPTVRGLMELVALTTMLVFPFIVVLMLYFVRHVLRVDARNMGLIMSASGLGSLIGALVLLFGNSLTFRRWLVAGILGIGIGLTGISMAHTVRASVPLVLILSFSVSSLMGRISQTIQGIVPNELRGRVMGIFGIAFTGLMPYAALLLSWLTDVIGFARTLQGCVVLYVVLGFLVLLRVPRPQRRLPAEPSPSVEVAV